MDHRKTDCSELADLIRQQKIRLNDRQRITNSATGREYPVNSGKGGMRALYREEVQSAGMNAIEIDSAPSATIGTEATTYLVTFHEDGSQTYELVDVEEKRKWDGDEGEKRARARTAADPPTAGTKSPTAETTARTSETTGSKSAKDLAAASIPKFKLATNVQGQADIPTVGGKLLEAPVTLTLRELLSTSSDLSSYLVDSCRRRRIPVSRPSTTAGTVEVESISAMEAPLYACVSPRVKVTMEDRIHLEALVDGGAEICLMPRRTFERLGLAIDVDIDWVIRAFDDRARKDVTNRNCIGVCHEVRLSVGGVVVKMPVFVVESAGHDLIHGRPWERFVRAVHTNGDDGALITKIQSPDGKKIVQIVTAPATHERNRACVRPATDHDDPLKA